MPKNDWRVPSSVCPSCGYELSGAGAAPGDPDPRPPSPGDTTVCIRCAAALIFDKDLKARRPTPEEEAAFHPELKRAIGTLQRQVREFRKAYKDGGSN